uniref:Tail protein n=1 Tax=viral metagenome TaxID=1070528 RepID=A0A6H1ZGT6_9ZZZZ
MGQITKRIQVGGSNEMLADFRNPQFPFLKGVFIVTHRYVVGTDFTSGDSLLIQLDGAQSVLFAAVKTPTNSFLTITEAALTAPRQGVSLATGTSTTDIEVFAIYTI